MKHILVLVGTALLLLSAIAGYSYLYLGISEAVKEITAVRAESSAAGEREATTRAANVFLAGTIESRNELASFVVREADFVSVIEMIEAAAKRERVTVTIGSVTVNKGDFQFHESVGIQISAKGSFSGLVAFLAALETFPVASRVVSVSLEASVENSWFSTVTFEFIKQKSVL